MAVIITTTDTIEGRRIAEVYGMVRGNTVRARAVGRDIVAGIRNIFGGEIREYSGLLSQAREEAISRMVEAAEQMGANAILACRFTTSSVMGGASEILVYGTAVKLEDA